MYSELTCGVKFTSTLVHLCSSKLFSYTIGDLQVYVQEINIRYYVGLSEYVA